MNSGCVGTYDAAGNMTEGPAPDSLSSTQKYVYDAWNRLAKVTDGETPIAKFEYDGTGRRILKIYDSQSPGTPDGVDACEHYLHGGDQVIETRQADLVAGVAPDADAIHPKYQNVWSGRYIDALILRDENTDPATDEQCDNGRIFYLADANFNVTAIVAESSRGEEDWAVRERYVYTPYGALTILDADFAPVPGNTSAYATTTLYTGSEYDAETGLYYYRARYYHVGLGRFVSRDPVQADINLYRYVANNPVVYVDPSGLYAADVHFYFTYSLARYLCLGGKSGYKLSDGTDASYALVIAWMTQHVDEDPNTCPTYSLSSSSIRQRHRFHLPDPDDAGGVRAGDSIVRELLGHRTLQGDFVGFGVFLHVYQDTWSHQGYGDVQGHFKIRPLDPDRPYLRPEVAEDMARAVYSQMRLLAISLGADKCCADWSSKSFEGFWSQIKDTLLVELEEESDRVQQWRTLTGASQGGTNDPDDPWVQAFRQAAVTVAAWYYGSKPIAASRVSEPALWTAGMSGAMRGGLDGASRVSEPALWTAGMSGAMWGGLGGASRVSRRSL